MNLLLADIKFLPGVGPKKAAILNKEIEVFTYEDLLNYFPYKYIDRSKLYLIREIRDCSQHIQIKGRFHSFEILGEGFKKRLLARFSDGRDFMEVVWFKGIPFILNKYKVGEEYILFGKPSVFGESFNFVHPDVELPNDSVVNLAGLQAYYNTTEKMKDAFLHSRALQKIIQNLVQSLPSALPESLPQRVIEQHRLLSYNEAIREIHFPTSTQTLQKAEFRLKFEELFYIQLKLLSQSKQRAKRFGGYPFHKIGAYFHSFYNQKLPFELTGAQKRVIKEIRADVGSGHQMNRLLQGDVGSGKTLVGLMVMLIALDNGFQACLMAPTEILASQHYETISQLVEGLGIEVALLTGSTKKRVRTVIHEGLQKGTIHLLIGTHALLEDSVQFNNLGLSIIDEQHRFGVAQRSKLWTKNDLSPHVLVMTATPIPRTLAMTLYGDLDVSTIDELPPGRKPIETIHIYQNREQQLYGSIRNQLSMGRQIYIVYPLIEESEAFDYKNLQDGLEHITKSFPEYTVGMLHGKMKPKEKEEVMQSFARNEVHILVATTVIEVGVNVPNASVMVIENADRFGLSQLHQLRGRVGRGADQSFCILVSDYKLSEDSRRRIETMTHTNDGFEIAEADLKLRGPGDLDGTQQSGIPIHLKIANLVKDSYILELSREAVLSILNADPQLTDPSNDFLRLQLISMQKKNTLWGVIS